MTNKTEHTGLPWVVSSAICGEHETETVAIYHCPSEYVTIEVVETGCKCGDDAVSKADAQFIVTAANYHYQLVELLDKALGCMLVGIDNFSIEDSEVYSAGNALVNELLDTKKA